MPRVIFGEREEKALSPGVVLDRIKPGGKEGPNGETHNDVPGGQTWIYEWLLGTPEDKFQLAIPDIRMPPQQIWPLHWHDCCVAVVVLDGSCLVGDWWMQPGDVLIARAELEYGPVVPGPAGTQLLEIFAQSHLRQGGYAPEYRDHPTLDGMSLFNIKERSALNSRNNGRQMLPNAGVDGIVMGHLKPGAVFNLGEPDDPERGLMVCTELKAGEEIAPHSYADARAIFVLEGELKFGERVLAKNDMVTIERDAPVPAFKAGAKGAQLLELTRTTVGLQRRPR
jgi:quercetin dioxygenase-like cupin family protein